jgi:hypothetical protein
MDPDNMTGVDASGNFIPDTGVMILVRVPAWVGPFFRGSWIRKSMHPQPLEIVAVNP